MAEATLGICPLLTNGRITRPRIILAGDFSRGAVVFDRQRGLGWQSENKLMNVCIDLGGIRGN